MSRIQIRHLYDNLRLRFEILKCTFDPIFQFPPMKFSHKYTADELSPAIDRPERLWRAIEIAQFLHFLPAEETWILHLK